MDSERGGDKGLPSERLTRQSSSTKKEKKSGKVSSAEGTANRESI